MKLWESQTWGWSWPPRHSHPVPNAIQHPSLPGTSPTSYPAPPGTNASSIFLILVILPLLQLTQLPAPDTVYTPGPSQVAAGTVNGAATLGSSLAVPQKAQRGLTECASRPALSYHPGEMNTRGHSKPWAQALPEALFVTAKTWKHPNVHQLTTIHRMRCSHRTSFSEARNEVLHLLRRVHL